MASWSASVTSSKVTSRSTPPARMRPSWCRSAWRNQPPSRPRHDRTYRLSPTRTTQIVVKGAGEPSDRRGAIWSSSAAPTASSSAANIASWRSSSLDRSVSGIGTGGRHLGNQANVVGCYPVLRGGKQPAGGGRGEGDAGRDQKALAESGQEAVRLGQPCSEAG